MKKVTPTQLRKMVLACGSGTNCTFYNEVDLTLATDINDKQTHDKIKFLYAGYSLVYKSKNKKKKTDTWDDWHPSERVWGWLNDKKNKQKKGDLVFIGGLIKWLNHKDSVWQEGSLQICDDNTISLNCGDDVTAYYYK